MSIPASTALDGHGELHAGGLESLLHEHALRAHFQPIVALRDAAIFGHESLIRGPAHSALALPDALFEAARRVTLVTALEYECIRAAISAWGANRTDGKLFLNLSASALTSVVADHRLEAALELLARNAVPAGAVVLELTEHERVGDIEQLCEIVELLRLHSIQLALDDFGDGRSSLRLWSELKPGFVKVDKYFTRGVAQDPDKLQTFRALLQIAETFGTELVAEGIETAEDLRAVRDLGVRYGQGWYLGRPQLEPVSEALPAAREVLQSPDVAVLPELRTAATGRRVTAAQLLVQAPTVGRKTSHEELYRLISRNPDLHAIAVVERDRPIALIDCQNFMNLYARPFFREVYGRRSCLMHANREPLVVEMQTGIDLLTSVLTTGDQRYLREGFIIVEEGKYRGLGTGQALVKTVTEARIEAARHANPLTFLPGNIPVTEHIRRLLTSGANFSAAYADLNRFKPYNDYYGYWRGDEMIRLLASVITAHADPQRDFVGHIGGDDFIIVFQSDDWQQRCSNAVREFNSRALELFDPDARAAGGIVSEDRHGEKRFHPCTTVSIGVARVTGNGHAGPEEVASAAAAAKRMAKQNESDYYVLECRAAA
jgi:diguanylate cyclase (GGDEF)-like protein